MDEGKLSVLPGRTGLLLSKSGFAKPKALQKQPQAHLSQLNDNNISGHFCLCVFWSGVDRQSCVVWSESSSQHPDSGLYL